MDITRLAEKLRRVESLHAGATTPGEKDAAAAARDRIVAKLRALGADDPAVEIRVAIADPWSQRLFVALARRYGLAPYRHHGQKRQTLMIKAPKRFIDEVFWPTFSAANQTLVDALDETAAEVLKAALGSDGA